jgi:hypothetical protein
MKPLHKGTPGYKDFFRFFVARDAARARREANDGPPYSDDPILARFHFCNVYREADTGTKFFHAHRAQKQARINDAIAHAEWLEVLLFQSYAYRPVNRITTFASFAESNNGLPLPLPHHAKRWIAHCRRLMAGGERVFTGRHLTRGLENYAELVDWLLSPVATAMPTGLQTVTREVIENEGNLEAVVKSVCVAPYIGRFFGWQIACDLMEAGAVHALEPWAHLGPGAINGAKLVDDSLKPLDVARKLADVDFQDEVFSGDKAPGSPGQLFQYPISIKDVEHALCEYARYCRVRANGFAGAGLEVKPWAK